jgi:hypothetical protein
MNKKFSNIFKQGLSLIWLSFILLLTSCGGGGNVSNSDLSNNSISRIGSGLGGTGTGEITAFGSIIVNDSRKFEINDETELFIDQVPVSEAELRQRGLGLFIHVYVAKDVNEDITAGTALSIFAENILKGPVTSVSPLQVFNQTIEITGDTVLVNTNENDLSIGDIVEVSGYLGIANDVQTTRLEYKSGGIVEWKLSGTMSNVSATRFTIGSQTVNIGDITPKECDQGLQDGINVEVKITPDTTFSTGKVINTATEIECADVTLYIPDDTPPSILKANFEGIVLRVEGSPITRMIVNNQTIHIHSTTVFIGGTMADLVAGARIEAEGTANTVTHELTANKIRFRQPRVRIEAPIDVPTTGLGTTFTLMDAIDVNMTASTRNEITTSGLQQVEVRGFVDKTGKVFAERVRDRGNVDFDDIRLRGSLAASNSSGLTFSILGVTIDASSARSIKDNNGNTIRLSQFFTQATEGTLVKVNKGTFSANPPIIRNAEIEIED